MADRQKFREVLHVLLPEIREDLSQRGVPSTANKRVEQCLIANTDGGKLHRGLTVVDTGGGLLQQPLNPTEFLDLSILGWLTEIFQASYLIWDDIMDNSEYRRGRLCWYRQDNVGRAAINDAALLRSLIYILLRKHFRHHPEYFGMLELFNEAGLRTELGQLSDMDTALRDHSLEDMTVETYSFITANKTAFYSFCLPVSLALHYFQLASKDNLEQVQRILLPMGEYFQVQDDYLDVFGDPSVTGKVGTDIRDNKCTWLIVQALRHCNTEQQQELSLSYGRQTNLAEAKVKRVFQDLGLERLYQEYEQKKIWELQNIISTVNEVNGLKKAVFQIALGKILRRKS
ncbi:isoprenoid synthase domain-containing protein [Aspergillus alliaceus]|uniref:Isoprenoid synthase domain-containing protein n=1 Tax=Petromyces alliaceus TaxID=209559 RepID=A0A5N7BQQ6_PETAA|nr:isoprenoid synthase domain-containing protein [Aspergillus alliaceus]